MMKIGQRIMDTRTKTIYRVTRVEDDSIVLMAEDESEELLIANKESQDSK